MASASVCGTSASFPMVGHLLAALALVGRLSDSSALAMPPGHVTVMSARLKNGSYPSWCWVALPETLVRKAVIGPVPCAAALLQKKQGSPCIEFSEEAFLAIPLVAVYTCGRAEKSALYIERLAS